MAEAKFEWKDTYCIGVESIDSMHQEIFRVINRLHKMVVINGNIKWTASEAIKYFISYAAKHFEDEEKYMLSIGYSAYEKHKRIHDGMRQKILPKMYSQLQNEKFSQEAVETFLGICEKWLVRHITGHDLELLKWAPRADVA